MTTKVKILEWVNSKGHSQGVFWTIFASLFSVLCDASIRSVSSSLPVMQIAFFRLFFGTMILFPILLYKGRSFFRMENKTGHLLRIVIGFGAMVFWIYGVTRTSLASVTTLSFTCPLLVLPFAYFFLGEKSDWRRILAVVVGFLGVIIIAFFEESRVGETTAVFSLHMGIVSLFLGAILFAMSDIANKRMIAYESLYSLLFYFYLGTSIISLIPALIVWQPVGYRELGYLFVLGFGGVSILYCILKAAHATEISSVAAYKYIEIVFSVVIGYLLFNEVMKVSTIVGASLIIPSSFLIAYYEITKDRKSRKK